LKQTGEPPNNFKHVTVREMFNRFGADEWDALRTTSAPARQAAE